MELSRRDFIRRMVGMGFSAATAGTLFTWLSCTRTDLQPQTPTPELTPPPSPPSAPAPCPARDGSPGHSTCRER